MENNQENAIHLVRKDYCELCGKSAHGEPHHMRPRSLGGKHNRENLIQLCTECHRLYHDGFISIRTLIEIVAKREAKTFEEIVVLMGWPKDKVLKEPSKLKEPAHKAFEGKSLEDLFQLWYNCDEREQETNWLRAAIAVTLLDGAQIKPAAIGSSVGCSASYVTQLARTWRTFPHEEERIPWLSFTHYKIAAMTEDPQGWITRAVDESLSTRQMEEEIRKTKDQKSVQEHNRIKADRIMRMVCEILNDGGEAAVYLKENLRNLLDETQEKAA